MTGTLMLVLRVPRASQQQNANEHTETVLLQGSISRLDLCPPPPTVPACPQLSREVCRHTF